MRQLNDEGRAPPEKTASLIGKETVKKRISNVE